MAGVKRLSLWHVTKSVGCAFFGVQSKKTHVQDFQFGDPKQFVIVGVLATVVFVILLYGIVQIFIQSAQ